jgi:hypothetical protein
MLSGEILVNNKKLIRRSFRFIANSLILLLILSSISVAILGGISGDNGTEFNGTNSRSSRENLPPNVNITNPENEATVSGMINITGHAWDDSNVTLVQVIINEVKYNATDDSGNSSWYTWYLEYNTTILSDGEYRIAAIAYDDGDKAGDFGIWVLVKNNASEEENHWPYVEITHPKNEATVSGIITIKGRAWDIDGNITLVQVIIYEVKYNATDTSGNGTWYYWSLVFNTTKLADGEYRVVALSKDDGEKLGDHGIWIIIKNTKENESPYVKITHPESEAIVSGVITIKGRAGDYDGNVTLVKVRLADVWYNATDTSGNGTWYTWSLVYNTTILEDGEYNIGAVAYDDGDKLADAGRWIIVKNNPEPKENHHPYVIFTSPKNEATVSGVITIKGRAWDIDGNVTSVRLRIWDIYYNATDTSGNSTWYTWSLELNTSKLSDGEYRVTALAKDDGGKLEDAHIWIIVKNKKEPKENHWPYVSITSPRNEATVAGVITIKGRAWDVDGNITSVRVRIADVWYNATDTSGNNTWHTWSLEYNTTKLKNDEYRVVAISKDDGGKLGDIGIWIIVKNKVDEKENKQPFIIIILPSNNAKVSGVIKIKGRAWDTDGKVISVKIRIKGVYYNAKDTSGNGSWYTWEFSWNTTKLENGTYKIDVIVSDGESSEDTSIEVKLANQPKEQSKKDKKPKRKKKIPGFELPFALIAVIVVVVAFFRRDIDRPRTK